MYQPQCDWNNISYGNYFSERKTSQNKTGAVWGDDSSATFSYSAANEWMAKGVQLKVEDTGWGWKYIWNFGCL